MMKQVGVHAVVSLITYLVTIALGFLVGQFILALVV